MREIAEIKADIVACARLKEKGNPLDVEREGLLWAELFQAITKDIPLDELEKLCESWRDGRFVVLPCKVGDTVWVDVRTLPYNYLHPLDGCKDFAKCEVIGFTKTRKDTYMKLSALYPSRMNRRGYLRYTVGAIGKTVFLTCTEAEKALEVQK